MRGQKVAIGIAWGNFRRDMALPPAVAAALFGLIPLLTVCCLGTGAYLVFRDDMLASLMRRQAQMQFAYEDRIAVLRSQIDGLASRQMLNQDSFEGKVAELAVRQARLESRSALVAALAAKVNPAETTSIPRQAPASATPALAAGKPMAPAAAESAWSSPKPAPQGFDLRRTQPLDNPREDVSDNSDTASPGEKLRNLAQSFDRIETRQIAALDRLRAPAAARAERLREAFAEAGLPVERMVRDAAARRGAPPAAAVGGPFEPATLADSGSAFDRVYASVSRNVQMIDGLRRALPYAPLRQPLPGQLEVTSTFGYRTDPFLGRPALHSGMDLRGDYGEPIRATAAGRVSFAGPASGYGNMVEIDHGAGLATRYGHMSRIDVDDGQWIQAGATIGAIGSTGRSTGPHLHYEVRVDGGAVDPSRYIKAGRLLSAGL